MNVNPELLEKINKIVNECTEKDYIININPTLSNLLNDDVYIYNLNNETLDTEKDTLNNIRQFINKKSEEKMSVGFSIYPTDYKENYVYSKHDASYIQEENEN